MSNYKRQNQHNANRRDKNGKDIDKYTRGDSRKPKNDAKQYNEGSTNHREWLAPTDDFAKGAGNIYFSRPIGVSWPTIEASNVFISGIAALDMYQCFGTPHAITDAINVASRRFYSFIRHANSGSSNYDAPDLMMYLMGLSSIHNALTWAKTIYGLLRIYSNENRYYPAQILAAHGVSDASVASNAADFRARLNVLISKANQFALPNKLNVMHRINWALSHIFTDSQSAKAQLYTFVPAGFHSYDLDDVDNKGFLDYVTWDHNSLHTYSELLDYVDTMIEKFLAHETLGIMSGDILKAYGSDLYTTDMCTEDYLPWIGYDIEAASMISNMTVVGPVNLPNIYQDPTDVRSNTGRLYTNFQSTDSTVPEYTLHGRHMMLSAPMGCDHTDPYNVLRMQYLKAMTVPEGSERFIRHANAFVVSQVRIITWRGNEFITTVYDGGLPVPNKMDQASTNDVLYAISYWSQFDYLPALPMRIGDTLSAMIPITLFYDINECAVMTEQDLIDSHYVTTLAEFDI